MRRPILLDNPLPQPKPPFMPLDRWSQFWRSRAVPVSARGAMGVAAVIGASVALAMLMPYMATPKAPAPTIAQASVSDMRSSVAAQTPVVTPAAAVKPATANGVQYVGHVKQPEVPCEQQTWPYIAKQCLKAAPEQKPANTVASVAVDRAEMKTSRAGLPAPAAPPEQLVAQTVAAAPQPAPIAEISAPPMPAARPVPRQTSRDQGRDAYARVPDESRRARPAREARDIRPDGYRTASDRNPSPVVRRWTEAEYDVAGPFGTTRRVVVIRPQSVHQAAAFSDER